ncbi:MAG TPA: rod shape-determining protein RodA [Victivallales bacterium]|nr:rod shape-determining protein RodA [Victivallales bacterium]
MKFIFQLPKKKDAEVSFILNLFSYLKTQVLRLDFIQIISSALLITMGLIFIYSAGQQVGGSMTKSWDKQILWICIGLVFWIILCSINYRTLGFLSPIIYLLSLGLLILVFFFGIKIYGARRWLNFGGINIQPSEFAKIATLLLAARIASLRTFKINKITHLIFLSAVVLIPFLMVLKQPDLGSSLVFIFILAAVAFTAKLSWKWIIVILIAGAVLIPSVYPFLKGYQKERILVFFNPDRDPLNQGWTSRQTLLSVGSGGFSGKGILNGTQNTLGFLPRSVSNSDLIFSVIAEESGFIGATTLIILYLILIFSMLRTSYLARDKFGYILAAGIAALFFEHLYVNIAMNIRLMPITGLPLPLVSYGGSFMITSLICLGILQSIYIRRRKKDE